MEEERTLCACCGEPILNDYYSTVGDDPVCSECEENECFTCECCGELIYNNDVCGQNYDRCLCESCIDQYYMYCDECDDLIHREAAYEYDDGYYCPQCYCRKTQLIHQYSYKPEPIFYGKGKRFLGVELEIDRGGKDTDHAGEILDIANPNGKPHIYIKSDSSIDDGMEIVTNPMTLEYHLNTLNWEGISKTAVRMGYRSHQTSTCGLHVHVNRDSLGEDESEQDETISRILYFVEHHWLELVKFSRRSESAMNRWAARFGYEPTPKALLDKAKSYYGRYYAVNLCNRHTIEFRLFRGTLKLNTLYATLQLVDRICETAISLDDDDLQALSWSEFVSRITEPELIQYLKERNLYVNEIIETEEEM